MNMASDASQTVVPASRMLWWTGLGAVPLALVVLSIVKPVLNDDAREGSCDNDHFLNLSLVLAFSLVFIPLLSLLRPERRPLQGDAG